MQDVIKYPVFSEGFPKEFNIAKGKGVSQKNLSFRKRSNLWRNRRLESGQSVQKCPISTIHSLQHQFLLDISTYLITNVQPCWGYKRWLAYCLYELQLLHIEHFDFVELRNTVQWIWICQYFSISTRQIDAKLLRFLQLREQVAPHFYT